MNLPYVRAALSRTPGRAMKMFPRILFVAIGLASFSAAPASIATLIGQTINADITISGKTILIS